jgi:hypothetical protein
MWLVVRLWGEHRTRHDGNFHTDKIMRGGDSPRRGCRQIGQLNAVVEDLSSVQHALPCDSCQPLR